MFSIYEYQWSAKNRFQQKQKGKRLAKNTEELEEYLLKKGYHQIKINRNFIFPKSPQREEFTQFISQLAMLVNAKLPLKQALMMILENCTNIKIYVWLEEIINWVDLGYAFSTALGKSKHYFSQQEIQLIKMGEMSSKLEIILTNIAKTRTESDKVLKKVKKVLFYPIVILSVSLALSIGLLLFIVPQFAMLYHSKEKQLPIITEILFDLSLFLRNNLIFLISILFISCFLFLLLAKKTEIIRRVKILLFSNLPVFNQIVHYSRIIFFHQSLALMLNANVRLDAVLNSFLSEKQEDPILQKELTLTLERLKQGYSLSESLNPALFNDQVIQMLSVGEKSSSLAEMSSYITDIYQEKLDYQIDILSQLLEPMLMLIMGIIVGTIIVGLYLPIFDMGSLVE